jgi:hypothetical protein
MAQVLGQPVGSALLYVLLSTPSIASLLGVVALIVLRFASPNGPAFGFDRLVLQETLLMPPVFVVQTLTDVISAFYNANGRFVYPLQPLL